MLTLVCGGRTFSDESYLDHFLTSYRHSITSIITGAQRKRHTLPNGAAYFIGADWLAQEWAINNEIDYLGFPAKWKLFGDIAGPARNAEMADYIARQPGNKQCIAFPGHNGTRNMIALCHAIGCPVILAGW